MSETTALRELVDGLISQFDHAGCTCTFPSDNCCAYARAIYWDRHQSEARTPSPVVSDEVVETVAKGMAVDQARRHYCIDRGPDEAWEAMTSYHRRERLAEARAALEASGYAAIKADNERMKEALKPFAAEADFKESGYSFEVPETAYCNVTLKDCRNARTILQEVSR